MSTLHGTLIRVTGLDFAAGLIVDQHDRIIAAAPIFKGYIGWPLADFSFIYRNSSLPQKGAIKIQRL